MFLNWTKLRIVYLRACLCVNRGKRSALASSNSSLTWPQLICWCYLWEGIWVNSGADNKESTSSFSSSVLHHKLPKSLQRTDKSSSLHLFHLPPLRSLYFKSLSTNSLLYLFLSQSRSHSFFLCQRMRDLSALFLLCKIKRSLSLSWVLFSWMKISTDTAVVTVETATSCQR